MAEHKIPCLTMASIPNDGEIIYWDNGAWKVKALSLNDLSDVEITNPQNGDVLVYSGGIWENQAP